MTITEFAAVVVALAVVATSVFLITAVNNLNNTLAKLESTANQLRDEGIGAFRDLRQLVADADAELDKVDQVLDRADQAMYRGKAQGRNQVVVFDQTLSDPG